MSIILKISVSSSPYTYN